MEESMFRTTLRVPQMDCAAEEQMIRMKLAQDTTIKRLDVDLPSRQLVVIHAGNDADIERAIRELRLDVEVIAHEAADDVLEDADETSQRTLLITVLLINLGLFFVGSIIGFIAHSMGLVADALDMLADALVYGLSLYAVGKAVARKKRVAAISGYFQLFLAILGVVEVLRRFFGNGEEPTFQLMITISIISLIGNTVSLILLQRSKNQEVHMQASKIFTSNDVIINLSVIVAGILVYMTGTNIPDLVVGGGVFLIVASGAFRILSLSK